MYIPLFLRSCITNTLAMFRMLSDDQWSWLESELRRPSEIKVIASGVQVLPPTDQRRGDQSDYCADGSHTPDDPTDESFDDAIHAVGEDLYWQGPPFEAWGEVPQERARLLQAAQRSLNDGAAAAVVFVSGDQHWAELHAKRVPESAAGGAAQVLYEVTASGIFQNIESNAANSNRLRDRSCDDRGSGPPIRECVFPFTYGGTTYTDCTWDDNDWEWCAYEVDSTGELVDNKWGYCEYASDELAQTTFSNSTHTCG
jgi:alkaline phosphatase D